MFYKRPSLRRGGMPTGIDTLSPRVQAQSGFFGTSQIRPMPSITGDFGRYNVGLSGGKLPFQERMMKSFPQDASAMGVASVVKPTKTTSTTNDLDDFIGSSLNSDFTVTETVIGPDGEKIQAYAEPQPSATVLANLPEFMGGISIYSDEYKDMIEKEKAEKSKEQKTEETKKEFERPNMLEIAGKVVANKGDKGDADKSKDTQVGGETEEYSFDSEYDKQMKRLEKYLGSTNRETKGKVALALSDAIGTPGSIADKATVLNKSLLGILGERKKDRRELAKIAFAATSELEKARILAEKPSEYEKRRNRYITLKNKKELSNEEKTELTALTSELGLDNKSNQLSLTDAGRLTEMLGDITANIDDYEKEKDPALKAELEADIRNAVLNVLQAKGVNQNIILSQEPRIKGFLKLAYGGRVNKAMGGGASETPAEPVATNLTFEQLRTRLPKEITDDIVRLVATSEEALQDFAYIRTQGDVEKFNVKYGVNLVLPQDTA